MEVQKALDDTGRKLAVYLTAGADNLAGNLAVGADNLAGNLVVNENNLADNLAVSENNLADNIVGRVAAEILLKKELTDRKEAGKYIAGGIAGVSLMGSEFEGDDVCLQATCRIRLPVKLIPIPDIRVVLKTECRKWTGLNVDGQTAGKDVWVYITETGTVYHRTKSCTHLALSIRDVDWAEVDELRNESGERYSACLLCSENENDSGRVYITNLGNRYHQDLKCSGIKRTILMVRLSEVGDRPACSKCGVQGQDDAE